MSLSLSITRRDRTATVALNRPDIHNAFNDELVKELAEAFVQFGEDTAIRAVVLTGTGETFCAGADLNWMKRMVSYTREKNLQDSRALSDMFEAIYKCPKPVLGRVNGSAFGGGLGLMAACDYVVSVPDAVFAFSEVKLGIAPAVISPYILRRVAPTRARYLFLSGERFGPEQALQLGLVDEEASLDSIDAVIEKKLNILASSGPVAVGKNKELVSEVLDMSWGDAREYAMELIAELRISPEGQEGIGAFLDKKKPGWSVK